MTQKLQWLIVVWLTILTGVVWVTRPKPLCEELQHLKLTGLDVELDLVRDIRDARINAEKASRLAGSASQIAGNVFVPEYKHIADVLEGKHYSERSLIWRLTVLDEFCVAEQLKLPATTLLPYADACARTDEGSQLTLNRLFSAAKALYTLDLVSKKEGG